MYQQRGDAVFYYVSALIFRKCPTYEILRNIAELHYRRMRYFPLSASCLPFCKFVRASIFQRFVQENCNGENTSRFRFNTYNVQIYGFSIRKRSKTLKTFTPLTYKRCRCNLKIRFLINVSGSDALNEI